MLEGLPSQIKGNSINYCIFCSIWGDHWVFVHGAKKNA